MQKSKQNRKSQKLPPSKNVRKYSRCIESYFISTHVYRAIYTMKSYKIKIESIYTMKSYKIKIESISSLLLRLDWTIRRLVGMLMLPSHKSAFYWILTPLHVLFLICLYISSHALSKLFEHRNSLLTINGKPIILEKVSPPGNYGR